MMRRNVVVVAVLAGLALIPVSLTFLCSGEGEDAVVEPSPGAVSSPTSEPSTTGGSPAAVPVFKSFENSRYQQYDRLIARFVDDFNRNPSKWIGGTSDQGKGVSKITAAQVKAHMIQETGGGDMRSRAAWSKDPLQANVPGDWNPYKKYLGLREPRRHAQRKGRTAPRPSGALLRRHRNHRRRLPRHLDRDHLRRKRHGH